MSEPVNSTPDLAEAAFYDAFARCDADAMRAIWAEQGAVCVHPGAAPIIGFEAVMRSWAHIFAGASPPLIETHVVQRIVEDSLAVHVLEERISTAAAPTERARVLATNVYRRIGGQWRMVAHHGSALPVRRAPARTLQ